MLTELFLSDLCLCLYDFNVINITFLSCFGIEYLHDFILMPPADI